MFYQLFITSFPKHLAVHVASVSDALNSKQDLILTDHPGDGYDTGHHPGSGYDSGNYPGDGYDTSHHLGSDYNRPMSGYNASNMIGYDNVNVPTVGYSVGYDDRDTPSLTGGRQSYHSGGGSNAPHDQSQMAAWFDSDV